MIDTVRLGPDDANAIQTGRRRVTKQRNGLMGKGFMASGSRSLLFPRCLISVLLMTGVFWSASIRASAITLGLLGRPTELTSLSWLPMTRRKQCALRWQL